MHCFRAHWDANGPHNVDEEHDVLLFQVLRCHLLAVLSHWSQGTSRLRYLPQVGNDGPGEVGTHKYVSLVRKAATLR